MERFAESRSSGGRRAKRSRSAWQIARAALALSISGALIRAAWNTADLRWALDGDVLAMVAIVLAPAGFCILAMVAGYTRSPPGWWKTAPGCSWWLATVCSLAWCEVLLDAGQVTGAIGKFAGGTIALLGTPLAGLAALFLALSARLRGESWAMVDWPSCGALLVLCWGWAWFLYIALALRF